MARNTDLLPDSHAFKGVSTQKEALEIVARRLARWSRFAGEASEGDMPNNVLDVALAGIRSRMNTLQSQLQEWLSITDV